MESFNNLSPGQAERLALLIEELSEAIQAACKILRHGYDNFHPDIPEVTNKFDLEKELGHVRAAINLMLPSDLDEFTVDLYKTRKLKSVKQWMHHQGD